MSAAICVITPCFNPGPYLLPCLRSVAALGPGILRHIVMDGGSTDGSQKVLADFAQQHPNLDWNSKKDNGQSDALNQALARVDTDYFGWLNADDVYLSGFTQLLASIDQPRQQPPTIIYGDYATIDADGRVLHFRRQPTFNYTDCVNSYLTVQNVASVFRTSATRNAGSFDDKLRFAMDYDLILKLARTGPVVHERSYAGCFRLHRTAKTATMPEICAQEIALLRSRFGASSSTLFRRFSKARVASRMAVQGCLGTRFGRGPMAEVSTELHGLHEARSNPLEGGGS